MSKKKLKKSHLWCQKDPKPIYFHRRLYTGIKEGQWYLQKTNSSLNT